jgi:hypothetical protein
MLRAVRPNRRCFSDPIGRSATFTRERKQPKRRPGRSEGVQKFPIGQRGDGHQTGPPPHAGTGHPIVERLFATTIISPRTHVRVKAILEQMFVFALSAV